MIGGGAYEGRFTSLGHECQIQLQRCRCGDTRPPATPGARVPLYSHGNPGAIPSDYTTVWWPEPIILTVDSYCQFQVAAIGAGKKAYWQAVVMELRGVRTWQQD